MEIKLHGKKAIISGSTTGIGFAIAKELARAGAAVLINGRTEKRVEEAVNRLKVELPEAKATGFAADLGSPTGVTQLLSFYPEADILINNLGIYEPKPFFEITDEDWEEYFQVNLMSAVRLSRHYGQGMLQNGWGRILFNGSVTAGFHSGEMVHYGATKAALLGLSRGLAESMERSGVTVNVFIPGPTRTENVEQFLQEHISSTGKTFAEWEEEMLTTSLQTSLLKRFVTPHEVANFVVFLASEQASAITGTAMRVDGGIVRSLL